MNNPFKYAMGGSPFADLDAPGQPVEDAGDVINMNDYLHSPDFLANQQMHMKSGLPPRTYYGGSAGRLGSPQGNADYERANDLEPGSLVESNAGRGDVTQFPSPNPDRLKREPFYNEKEGYFRDPDAYAQWQKERNANFDPGPPQKSIFEQAAERAELYGRPRPSASEVVGLSNKQAAQAENNQVSAIKGYMTSGNANVNQMKQWMNNPRIAPLVDRAIDGLSDEDFAAFRKNWNAASPDPDDHFNRGGYAFGGSPFNVERAASIGLQRESRAGFLNSGVPGRTDQIGLQVRNGSYVIPADVVSAAGQGNSLAGASAFDKLLKQGPYGTSMPNIRASRPAMPQMPRMQMARPIPTGGRGINNFGQAMRMPKLPGQADGGPQVDHNAPDLPYMAPEPMQGRGYGDWNVPKGPTWSQDDLNALSPSDRAVVMQYLGQSKAGGGNVTDEPEGGYSNRAKGQQDQPPKPRTDYQDWGGYGGYALASGGVAKKPRELVAPKDGNWSGMSAGGVSHPGAGHRIPILAAGGEYIVEPETVARVGNGDQQKGFRILDKLVLLTRKKHIDTLRKLKPPKQK